MSRGKKVLTGAAQATTALALLALASLAPAVAAASDPVLVGSETRADGLHCTYRLGNTTFERKTKKVACPSTAAPPASGNTATKASPPAPTAALRTPPAAAGGPGAQTLTVIKRAAGNLVEPADISAALTAVLGHSGGALKTAGTLTLTKPLVSGFAVLSVANTSQVSFGGGSKLLGEPRLMLGQSENFGQTSSGTVNVSLLPEAHRVYVITVTLSVLKTVAGFTQPQTSAAQFQLSSGSKVSQTDSVSIPQHGGQGVFPVPATVGVALVPSGGGGLVTVSISSPNSNWVFERCDISSVPAG